MATPNPLNSSPEPEARRGETAPIRSGRNSRVVSQCLLSYDPPHSDAALKAVRSDCLRWMSLRVGRSLPASVLDGGSFELDEMGVQRISIVSVDAPALWSARFDEADKHVAQRTWTTEMGIGMGKDGRLVFGVRLSCSEMGAHIPYERTIPWFVRGVIERGGARLDGVLIGDQVAFLDSFSEVQALADLLTSPSRTAPVIVLSTGVGSRDRSDTTLDADELRRRTLGAAHVFVLSGTGSFHLSDLLGREFSVYQRGVRTYFPGMDPEKDLPSSHPLLLEGRVNDPAGIGREGFLRQLSARALQVGAQRSDRDEVLPSFSKIKAFALRRQMAEARKDADSDSMLLKIAESEIEGLRELLESERRMHNELLSTAEHERDQVLQELDVMRARAFSLARRLDHAEARLVSAQCSPIETPIPDTLDGFEAWCSEHLAGRVELHSRAYQGVKKSLYHDHTLLYRSLLALRDGYVPMRRQGGEQRKEAFERALRDLGLEDGWAFKGSRWMEQGDTYLVQWGGKTCALERHLVRGVSMDPRHCFRLYYFWDAESQVVVVGWMPSHLDTRVS